MFLRFGVSLYLLAALVLDRLALSLGGAGVRHYVMVAVYPCVYVGKWHKNAPAPILARRRPFLVGCGGL